MPRSKFYNYCPALALRDPLPVCTRRTLGAPGTLAAHGVSAPLDRRTRPARRGCSEGRRDGVALMPAQGPLPRDVEVEVANYLSEQLVRPVRDRKSPRLNSSH